MPLRSAAAESLGHGSIRFELSNDEKRRSRRCEEKKYLTNDVENYLFLRFLFGFSQIFSFFHGKMVMIIYDHMIIAKLIKLPFQRCIIC